MEDGQEAVGLVEVDQDIDKDKDKPAPSSEGKVPVSYGSSTSPVKPADSLFTSSLDDSGVAMEISSPAKTSLSGKFDQFSFDQKIEDKASGI